MAVLALVWAGLVAYELVAPADQRGVLGVAGNVIWGVFVVECVAKLAVSGRPLRFLRRRWPSVLFLVLPVLRLFRVFRAVRALRVLPTARVLGSSYRTIGTARGLLEGRLAFLVVVTLVVLFAGGQLLVIRMGRDQRRVVAPARRWLGAAARRSPALRPLRLPPERARVLRPGRPRRRREA
jgi:voltage-gated potassium channel